MSSRRQEQVNSLIQRELGSILQVELELPLGTLLTISRVVVSPSLEHADIYITVLPDKQTKTVLTLLQKNIYHLQKLLNKKLVLKFVPKIRFQIDEGMQAENEVNKILDSLN
jgi:ribosome-binding factor A